MTATVRDSARREFTIVYPDLTYHMFTGVVCQASWPRRNEARACVEDVELAEYGSLLAPRGADELPQVSI